MRFSFTDRKHAPQEATDFLRGNARLAALLPAVQRMVNLQRDCAEVLPSSELTLDHVVPRSRGGASTWENLVACCHSCNRQKGNQFPVEADMKLMREPRAFNLHTSRHIMRLMGRSDDKWRKYLFY